MSEDLVARIAIYLDIPSICRLGQCCRLLHNWLNKPSVWKAACHNNYLDPLNLKRDYQRRMNMLRNTFITNAVKMDTIILALAWQDEFVYAADRAGMLHKIDPTSNLIVKSVKSNAFNTSCMDVTTFWIATGGWDCYISLVDFNLKVHHKIKVHCQIISIKFITSKLLAVGCVDEVCILNIEDINEMMRIPTKIMVTAIEVFNNLICAAVGVDVLCLNHEGFLKHRFQAHSEEITALAVGRSHMYTASEDGTIREWNLNWSNIHVYRGHLDGIRSLDCFNDFLVSGSYDNTIILWSTDRKKLMACYNEHQGDVNAVKLCNYTICSGSDDFTVRFHHFDYMVKS
jgi:WD40 repeat protein